MTPPEAHKIAVIALFIIGLILMVDGCEKRRDIIDEPVFRGEVLT